MAQLQIDADNAIYYQHTPAKGGVTFTFFNALTGDAAMWLAAIAPALHEQGHGTLVWNFRGQVDSPCSDDMALGAETIVADATRLLTELQPVKPAFVGLSIGGLFAAQTWLGGANAAGLVLINTLRRPGARLRWLNDAALRCVEVGGLELMKDLYGPLIFNEEWLAENHNTAFQSTSYTGLTPDQGHYRLLRDGRSADWNIPYNKLTLPVLVMTGLQDDMFLNINDVEHYCAQLPQARRVDVADAGHMVPVERPQVFTQALLDFATGL